jgi:hypothetical protein
MPPGIVGLSGLLTLSVDPMNKRSTPYGAGLREQIKVIIGGNR